MSESARSVGGVEAMSFPEWRARGPGKGGVECCGGEDTLGVLGSVVLTVGGGLGGGWGCAGWGVGYFAGANVERLDGFRCGWVWERQGLNIRCSHHHVVLSIQLPLPLWRIQDHCTRIRPSDQVELILNQVQPNSYLTLGIQSDCFSITSDIKLT